MIATVQTTAEDATEDAPVKKFTGASARTLRSCATSNPIDRRADCLKGPGGRSFVGVWPFSKMPKGEGKNRGKKREWVYHPTRGWLSHRVAT